MRAVRHMINVFTKPIGVTYPWTPTLAERVCGRTVLVTGASSGIGRRLAERVAEAGGIVIVTARVPMSSARWCAVSPHVMALPTLCPVICPRPQGRTRWPMRCSKALGRRTFWC